MKNVYCGKEYQLLLNSLPKHSQKAKVHINNFAIKILSFLLFFTNLLHFYSELVNKSIKLKLFWFNSVNSASKWNENHFNKELCSFHKINIHQMVNFIAWHNTLYSWEFLSLKSFLTNVLFRRSLKPLYGARSASCR